MLGVIVSVGVYVSVTVKVSVKVFVMTGVLVGVPVYVAVLVQLLVGVVVNVGVLVSVKVLETVFVKVGVLVAVVEPERKDLFPLLNMVREKKAHALFYAGPLDQAAAIAALSRELGSGAQFSTLDVNAVPEYVKKSKDASSGSQFALKSPVVLTYIKKIRPLVNKVWQKYRVTDASLPYLYDAAQLVFSGLDAGTKSRDELRDFIKEQKTKGATGEIRFTDSGERLGANVYMYIVQKKEFFWRKLGYEESKAYSEAK